jgi:hypothetical protein
VFENRVLRRIFGTQRNEVTGVGENYLTISIMNSSPNIIWVSKKNEMGVACSRCRREVHTGIWWGNLSERDHLEDLSTDKTMIVKEIFKKWDGEA